LRAPGKILYLNERLTSFVRVTTIEERIDLTNFVGIESGSDEDEFLSH